MSEQKKLERKITLTAAGLLLCTLPLWAGPVQGESLALWIMLLLPGSSMTSAGILQLLLEVDRLRTYRRALEPLSFILLAVGGGGLCAAGILLRKFSLLVPGVPMVLAGIGLLVRFLKQEQGQSAERKKRKKRRRR